MAHRCAVIHSNEPCEPPDPRGCILPIGHAGPHEFVSTDNVRYQWMVDPDCSCADCMEGDGCTIYWEKRPGA